MVRGAFRRRRAGADYRADRLRGDHEKGVRQDDAGAALAVEKFEKGSLHREGKVAVAGREAGAQAFAGDGRLFAQARFAFVAVGLDRGRRRRLRHQGVRSARLRIASEKGVHFRSERRAEQKGVRTPPQRPGEG